MAVNSENFLGVVTAERENSNGVVDVDGGWSVGRDGADVSLKRLWWALLSSVD